MIAEFRTAGGDIVPVPANATLSVSSYDAEAVGGFKSAEMSMIGPPSALWQPTRWLGYRVTICDDNHMPVWYGMLHEVVVATGTIEVGVSLANMYNRIKVAYTIEPPGGAVERRTTDWSEDSDSVSRYGYKELLFSVSDTSTEVATAQRDTLLATFSTPQPYLRITAAPVPTTTLRAIGLYETLSWRYYEQLAGKEEHTSGGQSQPIGQGFTASTIGFTSDGRIHDSGNRLDELSTDIRVQVGGSTSNDGAYLVTSHGSDGQAYVSSGVSFDPSDDVHDSSSGFTFISQDDIITISGSSSNDGTMRVKTASSDHLTVSQAIVYESAGASVTLTQFGSIQTDGSFTNELPSASVTLTVHGQKVAQSFTPSVNATWTVDKIEIRLRKVGSPSDLVKVELCSDSSGSPGSALNSATVVAANIGTDIDWIEFDLGNSISISYGTTYWIVVSRTDVNDVDDYYVVDVDEDTGYSGGSLKVYTGSAWTTRYVDADMLFRVLGAVETTTQISTIYSDIGQFFTAIDSVDASGVYSNQYREGDTTAKDEIDKLLSAGDSNGTRLLASVSPVGVLKIYAQPASGINNLMLRSDGRVSWQSGTLIRDGWLPVANWLQLTEVPGNVDVLASIANIFIERSEWRDGLSVEPQGTPSPWDLGNV